MSRGMPQELPVAAVSAARTTTQTRSKRSLRAKDNGDTGQSTASRRAGVFSGPEDHLENPYSQKINNKKSDNLQTAEVEPEPTGGRGVVGARKTRMGMRLSHNMEQDDPRVAVARARAIESLPASSASGSRTETVGQNLASRNEKEGGHPEEEELIPCNREEELRGFAELVKAQVERAADEQVFEHLKQETAKAVKEMAILRQKLGRAEAAVEGGKQQHNAIVAELQSKLNHCQQQRRRLEAEAEDHRVTQAKSVVEETRLREELKRTQEALSFLSAWDEEKIELDEEVASLKKKLTAAVEEGNKRLEEAQRVLVITTAAEGQKARARLASATRKIRLELERGLSEEFRSRRRENDVLRRERGHQHNEINIIMKDVATLEARESATRAELDDERRMHDMTIRAKKRAEAVIAELQTRLSDASSPSRRCFSLPNDPSPRRSIPLRGATGKPPWNVYRPSPRHAPPTGRAKLLVGGHDLVGGSSGARGGWGGARGDEHRDIILGAKLSPGRHEAELDTGGGHKVGKVSGLLVPARSLEESSAPNGEEEAAGEFLTADAFKPSGGGRKRRRNSSTDIVGGIGSCGGDTKSVTFEDAIEHDDDDVGTGENDVPELLPCGSSEISSADVWSMLDSYINQRSEVARANRHVRAIEAMRKHLAKSTGRANVPTVGSLSTAASNTARLRIRMDEGNYTNNEESVWRASEGKWLQQRSEDETAKSRRGEETLKFASYVKERRRVSGGGRRIFSKASPTKGTKSKKRFEPHAPACRRNSRLPGDGSLSTLSQTTAVRTWNMSEEYEDCLSEAPHRRHLSPTIHPDGFRGLERGKNKGGATTAADGQKPQGYNNHDNGEEDGKNGERTVTPLPLLQGSRSCSPDGDYCRDLDGSNSARVEESRQASSVTVRSPSSASLAVTKTTAGTTKEAAAKAVVDRLWGKNITKGAFTVERRSAIREPSAVQKSHRRGRLAGSGKKVAGLDRKRRTCREAELAEWIACNTNLVNVSPW